MDPKKLEKLDKFEEALTKATLEPGTARITATEWQTMYSLSRSLHSYDEQEALGDYIKQKLKIFSDYWNGRLETISTENEKLIEEFSLFWTSVQLYIYTKHGMFGEFLMSFAQEKFAALAFKEFKKDFFVKNIPRVSKTLIYLINQDRQDIKVPRTEMIKVIQMVQEIGFGDDIEIEKSATGTLRYKPKTGSRESEIYLKYYRASFEKLLIEDLISYTRSNSEVWIKLTSVEYCKLAKKFYQGELDRATNYYYLSKSKVDENLNNILIVETYAQICNSSTGIVSIVKKNDDENIGQSFEDLKEIYTFFKFGVKSIQDYTAALKELANTLGGFIKSEIKGYAAKDNKDAASSVTIINDLIKLYKLIKAFQEKSMDNDLHITNENETSFLVTINEDKNFPTRFAEWANDHLSQPEDARANNNTIVDDFVSLSRKIYDKDIFLKKSMEFLAVRLLQEKPNTDGEKVFWGKMGTEWGLGDLNKMHSMMDDIKLSSEFAVNWRKNLERLNPDQNEFLLDSLKILRESSWPQKILVKDKAIFKNSFNAEIAKQIKHLEDYYIKSGNNGKTLDFMINQGNANLITVSAGKKYYIAATIPQMAVLLLFNDFPSMKLLEIKAKLALDDKTKRFALDAVRALVRFQFCSWTRNGTQVDDKDKKEVPQDEDEFVVSKEYKGKALKVNMISKPVVKREEETKEAQDDINKDRGFVIDATVVRVMKSKRELSLVDLQQEVKKIITMFVPDPKLVKKRIDALIEQDYLERHPKSNNVFIYKP